MTDKDNTLKKDAPKKETTPKEKVEKTVDVRKELTEKEAQEIVDKENKPEASQESKEEKKEEPKEKPEVELPERYKGKSAEELVKLLEEKEKFIQSRSDEIGDWKQKVKEAEELGKKVAKIEEETIKEDQQPRKLPQRPVAPVISDEEYYNDPPKAMNKLIEHNKKLADYVDQITSAKTAPFYQGDMERRREKIYKVLEEKYKDSPVKFDREKVQEFLIKNPEYFKQYKTNAYEQAYHDISAPDLSKSREKIREEVKVEIIEEMKTNKQAASVGFNDLETTPTGEVKEYDKVKMEEDPEYRKQAIDDMKKKAKK